MHYFVYVKDLISIETEKKNFVWTFGRSLYEADKDTFDRSLIKIHLCVKNDNLISIDAENRGNYSKFSSFFVSTEKKEIIFQKKILRTLLIAFKLKIDGNDIYFSVGRRYYDLVKLRLMNVHSARYILSDLVSAMLLMNNYAPLYCATLSLDDKTVMIFGGPGIGKTLTATQLLKQYGFSLLSEDVSVSDGKTLWSVPFTSTYGQHDRTINKSKMPIEGELIKKFSDRKYIFILEDTIEKTNVSIIDKILLLNRYLFHYDCSPVTMVLAYFFKDFDLTQIRNNEFKIVKDIYDNSVCSVLQEKDPILFADQIIQSVNDSMR